MTARDLIESAMYVTPDESSFCRCGHRESAHFAHAETDHNAICTIDGCNCTDFDRRAKQNDMG